MKTVSVSDLLTLPEFQGMNEVQLIHPSNDRKVVPYLYVIGLDYKKGYEVVAYKHRNQQNKVVVGYLYSGECRLDDEYRSGSMCSSIDRVIMSSKKDFSLTKELATLMGGGLHYGKFDTEENENDGTQYLAVGLYEDDYEEVSGILKTLRQVALDIRGIPYNDRGSLKTLEEYEAEISA